TERRRLAGGRDATNAEAHGFARAFELSDSVVLEEAHTAGRHDETLELRREIDSRSDLVRDARSRSRQERGGDEDGAEKLYARLTTRCTRLFRCEVIWFQVRSKSIRRGSHRLVRQSEYPKRKTGSPAAPTSSVGLQNFAHGRKPEKLYLGE